MHRSTFAATFGLLCLTVSTATAQEGSSPQVQAGNPASAEIIMTAPNQTSASQVYFRSDLDELNASIRRTRVALISTSGVFALGIILASIGASQCTYFDNYYDNTDFVCNNAGDVLVPLGAGIGSAGVIGMLTSGIMLGVKK
ncbi:MAG: hypothetical protein WCE62_08440, partial [Polyangiales bacterium]